MTNPISESMKKSQKEFKENFLTPKHFADDPHEANLDGIPQFIASREKALLQAVGEVVVDKLKEYRCIGPHDEKHKCSALHCNHCGVCEALTDIQRIIKEAL